MPRRAILALDQGTTSSRAVVFSAEGADRGRVLGEGRRELACRYPRPGWVEQDPAEIWRSQLDAAKAAIASGGVAPSQILGVGITNQRETVMLWERSSGRAIGPAIVWQDRRTTDRTQRLRDEGTEPLLVDRTGLLADPYFSASKIEWLLDEQPGARGGAERGELAMGTVDSWLAWNLSGGRVHATDPSNASRTQLWNLDSATWDEELLRLFRVPRALLPAVLPSAGRIGECDAAVLGAAIPILGMIGDQQSALAGQGCVAPGDSKTTYGTGCFLLVQTGGRRVRSGARLLSTVAWRIGDGPLQHALEGSVFMGGATVQWMRDGLGIIRDAAEIGELAASVEDSEGVVMVPSFTGLGAPHWDPSARGMILGLTRGSTKAHLARALLEGVAMQVADVIEAADHDLEAAKVRPVSAVRVDGGAAASDPLMQVQADVLGIPIERPRRLETTVFGAAGMAAVAAGVVPDLAAWRGEAAVERRFEPRRDEGWRGTRRRRWSEAVAVATRWGTR